MLPRQLMQGNDAPQLHLHAYKPDARMDSIGPQGCTLTNMDGRLGISRPQHGVAPQPAVVMVPGSELLVFSSEIMVRTMKWHT